MKIGYLVAVGLILAIMTISSASAFEDANSTVCLDDSNQTQNDVLEVEAQDNANYSDVDCAINPVVEKDEIPELCRPVVEFNSKNVSVVGNLEVFVNGTLKYNNTINESDYVYSLDSGCNEYGLYLNPYDLKMDYGTYDVAVVLNGKLLNQSTVKVEFPFLISDTIGWRDYYYYEDLEFYVYLPSDATGNLSVFINGRTYEAKHKNGEAEIKISTDGWVIGRYNATATYWGDEKYEPQNKTCEFVLAPIIEYPEVMAKGEKQYFTFRASNVSNGYAVLYRTYYDDKGVEVKELFKNITVKNGLGKFSLADLKVDYYPLYLEYSVGNLCDEFAVLIDVCRNSPKFSLTVSPKKVYEWESVNINLKGPKINKKVQIYLDNKKVKSLSFKKGKISYSLSKLSVGKHRIRVYIKNLPLYFSDTIDITVKKTPEVFISLKKVKVKRSSKRLVLAATLKLNGKAVKNKVVKFKFNGKNFKAKTDKKGIAKVTIKKSQLKRLKVGKKVTYLAKYGDEISKRKVKVKR